MSGTKPAANLLDNISGLLYVGLSLDAYLASALGSTFACFSQLVVHVSLHRWLHFCLLLASMCFQDTRCSACSLKVQSFSLFLLFKRIAGSMTEDSFHDRHVHFRSIRSDVSEGRLHLIMQSNLSDITSAANQFVLLLHCISLLLRIQSVSIGYTHLDESPGSGTEEYKPGSRGRRALPYYGVCFQIPRR
ncbi:hypothetical protein J3E74DRAFT_357432 [Bipolaris maydis]|nr:hypothetical protein J3E74DRAFT_399760 [Bipolaris maydis]KAJ5033243.1 hypothetical protein J3E74DRAFT_399525 [Bipolaris maydis]KAJ5058083.1 hypothetical protein J3E74DRAFT_357432 [Bipolaris maydis]